MTITHSERTSAARLRAGTAITIVAGALLLGSGIAKMLGVAAVVRPIEAYGFVHTVPLVAALEIASGILFLLPRTRSFGLVFASAFMGGAIATHIQHAEVAQLVPAVAVLGLVWAGTWLRHPVALWSF